MKKLLQQPKLLQIPRYDSEHRRSGITQPVLPAMPTTSPPPPPTQTQSVVAASVVIWHVPLGGLTLANLREYTEDEVDAELRA